MPGHGVVGLVRASARWSGSSTRARSRWSSIDGFLVQPTFPTRVLSSISGAVELGGPSGGRSNVATVIQRLEQVNLIVQLEEREAKLAEAFVPLFVPGPADQQIAGSVLPEPKRPLLKDDPERCALGVVRLRLWSTGLRPSQLVRR